MQVTLRVLLVHELLYQLLLRDLSETFEIVPEFIIAIDAFDSLRKDADSSNGREELHVTIVVSVKDLVELVHDVPEQLHVGVLVYLETVRDRVQKAEKQLVSCISHLDVLEDA